MSPVARATIAGAAGVLAARYLPPYVARWIPEDKTIRDLSTLAIGASATGLAFYMMGGK